MKTVSRLSIAVASAAALGVVLSQPVAAQSAAEKFYEGKQLSLMIGSEVGNGYDIYGRLVAKYMEKYLPKGATIVPKNMPGASGVVVTNHVMNVADGDGTIMGLCQREAPFEPIYTPKASQAKYDPKQIAWIGTPNQEFGMFYFTTKSGVAVPDDAKKKEILMGASGGGAAQTITIPRVINAMIGTKFKMITGYGSGNEVILAMERGEVDGRFASGWAGIEPTKAGELIAVGKARLGFTFSAERKPQVGSIPTILESVTNPEHREVLQVLMAPQPFGRPIFASPKVPAERLKVLRDAFDKAVKDKDFVAEAVDKYKFDVSPLGGEELGERLRKTYALPEAALARTVAMMEEAAQVK